MHCGSLFVWPPERTITLSELEQKPARADFIIAFNSRSQTFWRVATSEQEWKQTRFSEGFGTEPPGALTGHCEHPN